MSKRFRTRRIKANKSYRIDELAQATGVTSPTVRNWIKNGMACVDGNRPTLIIGFQALEFLNARKSNSNQPMALGEFYCLRCKAPRSPLGGMADYEPSSARGGGVLRRFVASVNAPAIAISAPLRCPKFHPYWMLKSEALGRAIRTPQPPLKLALQKGR